MLLVVFNWLSKKLGRNSTMSSSLNEYIISNNPQNAGDIERLERKFLEEITRGKFLWKKFGQY